MSELTFAKSFLATLDARPTKLQPDHAADLKTLELKGPYTLPRYPSSPPMHPPTTTTPSPSQQPVNITLKSLRNPPLSLRLPAQPLTTSIFDLKTSVAEALRMGEKGTEGVKILYARKPAGDAKTVGEVLGEEGLGKGDGEVEMGVMVMGGVEGEKGDGEMVGGEAATGEGGRVAQGVRGEEVMGSAEFWEDLRGWLMQRVRDEGMAGEAWSLFKRGWDGR